jgi:hypothetical protein
MWGKNMIMFISLSYMTFYLCFPNHSIDKVVVIAMNHSVHKIRVIIQEWMNKWLLYCDIYQYPALHIVVG